MFILVSSIPHAVKHIRKPSPNMVILIPTALCSGLFCSGRNMCTKCLPGGFISIEESNKEGNIP